MTSTTDTTRHPDVTEISDLTEGLLPPPRAAEVHRHVEGCEPCGEVHAALQEIRELLGSTPEPPRMPDDVADRIDAALAAEAALADTEAPDDSAHVSRETELLPIQKSVPDPGSPPDRPAGRPRAATGPGRRPVRRSRRVAVLGAALGAAMIGMSVFIIQGLQPTHDSAGISASDRRSGSTASNEDTFSGTPLESRVHTLLLGAKMKPSGPDDFHTEKQAPSVGAQSTPTGDSTALPQTPLRAPTVSVPACVQQGIGRKAPALAAETGAYEGTSAFLVVLPHPSDTGRVQAYVVDATCVQNSTDKGELLLTRTYARP
ncbi:anti-sigma factor family protein [Streptomyces sp. NPDC014685]|uniref:anti-sigma factor family protein n=1 Tax=Streptomyces sp. NPDC014685 TaxID=3364881 RepID=UPI0036FDE27E